VRRNDRVAILGTIHPTRWHWALHTIGIFFFLSFCCVIHPLNQRFDEILAIAILSNPRNYHLVLRCGKSRHDFGGISFLFFLFYFFFIALLLGIAVVKAGD
tara:strand:+ start:192 stop:494 length:303 start_codon:yes stop_codon:yes gene_type:complete